MELYDLTAPLFPPEPAEHPELHNFGFRLEAELEGMDGIFWNGVITYKDKDLLNVENRGDGGCNHYRGADSADLEFFKEVARAVYPTMAEPEDILAMWLDIENEKKRYDDATRGY